MLPIGLRTTTHFRDNSDIEERKMKRIIAALLCAVLVMGVLVSCSKGNKFVSDGGKYVDKKTNVSYIDAPACYEPIAMSEKLYGTLDEVKLYEIIGADPQKWLAETTGTVFYADGVTLPTLSQMTISRADILVDGTTSIPVETEHTSALAAAYRDGESVLYTSPSKDIIKRSVVVRFADESLGLYYRLTYIELTEDYVIDNINYGKRFLLNRFEDYRFVPVGDFLDAYFAAESE